jgi:hypothetical protein
MMNDRCILSAISNLCLQQRLLFIVLAAPAAKTVCFVLAAPAAKTVCSVLAAPAAKTNTTNTAGSDSCQQY